MDQKIRAPAMVEAKMGDDKVKETVKMESKLVKNKIPNLRQEKTNNFQSRTMKPQDLSNLKTGGHGAHAGTLNKSIPTTTNKSKLPAPLNRRKQAKEDPMRTSRSSIVPSPSKKLEPERIRSKSHLELIPGSLKPIAQFNNSSFISLSRNKVSSASSISNFHRPGTRPSYLDKPNQLALESQLTEKHRKFAVTKKRMVENQEQCKQQFSEIAELNSKLSRINGKQTKLEKIQLVYLIPSDDGTSAEEVVELESTEKNTNTDNDGLDKTLVNTVVQATTPNCTFNPTLTLLEDFQSVPLTFFKDSFSSISNLLSKVSTVDDIPPIVSKLNSLILNYEKQIVQAHEEQLRNHSRQNEEKEIKVVDLQMQLQGLEIKDSLRRTALQVRKCESVEFVETMSEHLEYYRNDVDLNYKSELEKLTLDHNVLKQKHDNLSREMKELVLFKENNINQTQKFCECKAIQQQYEVMLKEAEIEKNKLSQEYQARVQDMDQEYLQLKEEFAFYRTQTEDDQIKLNEAALQIHKLTNSNQVAIHTCDELRDRIAKFDSERCALETKFQQLISEEKDKQEFLTAELNSARIQLSEKCADVNQHHLQRLEQQLQVIQFENTGLRLESTEFDTVRQHLKTETARAEQYELQVAKLQRQIRHKCGVLQKMEQTYELDSKITQQLRHEHEQLREMHEQQSAALALVQQKLEDSQTQCRQHEETIAMHQRILRIRSELIGVLRKKGDSTRCRMVDLYTEVGKKSTLVNKMDFEISAREEEMHNLFSTLSTKQMEVSRQDKLIKMLEECNAHNLKIRSRQFERITRLEKEKNELKKRLLLGGGSELVMEAEHETTEDVASAETVDAAFNHEMYCEERRKKCRERSAIVKPKTSSPRIKREHSESTLESAHAKCRKHMDSLYTFH